MRPIAAVLVLLVACGIDHGDEKPAAQNPSPTTAEPAAGTYALGSSITGDGAIVEDAVGDSFVRGGPIFLSIDVTGATADQRIEVEWIDARGTVVHREQRLVRQGSRHAAFSTGPTAQWQPGTYRVVVVIDGRRVNEQPLRVD